MADPTFDVTRYLADPASLAAKLGLGANDPTMLASLEEASRRFRSAVHHLVHFVEDDEVELDAPGSRVILLPEAPVVSISSFTIDDGPELVAKRDYRLSKKAGILHAWPAGRSWPFIPGGVQLIYSHGYTASTLPSDIQGAVLDMAETIGNVVKGLQSKTVLGDSVSFGTISVTGSTQAWSDAVANYAINRSA